MLICSNCLEKEAVWTDSSTKYKWCKDCVPRGCSCNNEYYLHTKKEDIKNNNIFNEENYEEILKNIKLRYEKGELFKILYSKNGVVEEFLFNNKYKSYVLHSNVAKYKKLNIKDLYNKKKFNKILKNTKGTIKLIPLDKNKKEFPCVEIMYLTENLKKEKGEFLYSLSRGNLYKINEIYKNGSFRLYDDTTFNYIYYPKEGIILNNNEIDLVISEYEKEDKEFQLLEKLIFRTFETGLLDYFYKNKKIYNQYKEKLEYYNDDLSFYFSEYNNKEIINKEIKSSIIKYLKIHVNNKYVKKLFKLLVLFHKVNKKIKFIDNQSDFVCENNMDSNLFIKREKYFKQLFNILYNEIK